MRVTDKKTAGAVKATRAGEVIFLDPEGEEFNRGTFTNASTLDALMAGALKKFGPRAVDWATLNVKQPGFPREDKRPVVLVFADEGKESTETLAALEDRWIARFHDKFVFVRVSYRRESEEAKKWRVSQAPTLVFAEPSKGEEVDRASGRQGPKALKAVFVRVLGKISRR